MAGSNNTINDKRTAVSGDRTTTGAQCIANSRWAVNGKLSLRVGDKTTPCPACGKSGVITSGDPTRTLNGITAAIDGSDVLCGCPPGTNKVVASGGYVAASATSSPEQTEPAQHAQAAKHRHGIVDTCKPKDNLLLNGVYLWTEITGAGHAFVSVHENNSIFLYTYGRYGRTGPGSATGDGILNFLMGEDARAYYRSELYRMKARAFRIDDADPELTRKFFEDLWNSSAPAIQTPDMPDTTRRRGRTIDDYDVTGKNCTTHSVAGIKYSGSKVFENGYASMTTQLPIEAEEDFTIPVSLQRYLVKKGSDMSSMLVVEMTSIFKEQYPNSDNFQELHVSSRGKIQKTAAESAAVGDSLSPYSGGTIGGVLGGSYDVNE